MVVYHGKETAREIASLKRWLAELESTTGSSRGGKKKKLGEVK